MMMQMSERVTVGMKAAMSEVLKRAVEDLSELYGFDAGEASEKLCLADLKVSVNKEKRDRVRVVKERVEKVKGAAFPLPWSGAQMEGCCTGVRQNHGLYTQCGVKVSEGYCKVCASQAAKNASGKPDCGDVSDRLACGAMDYKDAKGRSPVAYSKLMLKLKLSKEQVLAEAARLGLEVAEWHFEVAESKRGRPKSSKASAGGSDSESEGPKKRGRPKKAAKVVEAADGVSDLFASLVHDVAVEVEADADMSSVSSGSESESESKSSKKSKKSKLSVEEKQEKEANKAMKAAEKESKEAEKAAKLAEKAEKLAAEKAEKAEKLAAEKAEKAEKLAAEKAVKLAEKEAEKAAKLAAKKESKPAAAKKESKKKASAVEVVAAVIVDDAELTEDEVEEEELAVEPFSFKGISYLKSDDNVLYNVETSEPMGVWNEKTQTVDELAEDSDEEDDE